MTTRALLVGEAMASTHLDTIYRHQYIFVAKGSGKEAHEVNSRYIKQLNHQNVVKWHLMLSRNIPSCLALIAPSHVIIGISENSGPV